MPNNHAKEKKLASSAFRETLQFYLIDCKTPLGKFIDIFIILLNLAICSIFVIETYPVSEATRRLIWNIEVIIVLFFMVEYVARLYGAKNRLKQLLDVYSIVDFIAILPTLSLLVLPVFGLSPNFGFIKIIRVIRVFRIFRFLRFTADPHFFFGDITVSFLNLIRLFLTILMIFFISSGLFFYVESGSNPGVQTFGDAFYFTVVTPHNRGIRRHHPLVRGRKMGDRADDTFRHHPHPLAGKPYRQGMDSHCHKKRGPLPGVRPSLP